MRVSNYFINKTHREAPSRIVLMSKGHLLEEDNAYGNDVIKRRHLDDVIHIGRFFFDTLQDTNAVTVH